MVETFEFYVELPDGSCRMRPVTCAFADLMGRADALLVETAAQAIEVRQGGRHLFVLAEPEGRRSTA